MKLIYIHGMNTETPKETLKKQWDKALFGSSSAPEAAHTSMAYWAVPERAAMYRIQAVKIKDPFAEKLENRLLSNIDKNKDTRLLPSKELRDAALNWVSNHMPDLKAYLYEGERDRMCGVLMHELEEAQRSDKEIMIIAHSMGTMIAFDTLSHSSIKVKSFITIGSPLGLEEIQDRYKEWYKDWSSPLPAPCGAVAEWNNFANRFDAVALDAHLRDDFAPEKFVQDCVGLWLRDWHSAERYLGWDKVRSAVRRAWGKKGNAIRKKRKKEKKGTFPKGTLEIDVTY